LAFQNENDPMPRIYLVHWHREECLAKVRELRAGGHTVTCHYAAMTKPKVPQKPDAYVVSLARLPSHGRHMARWLHETKKRRLIPLIFVDGEPDKVAVAREQFPEAASCRWAQLGKLLGKLGG